jgi:glycine/D-amino acid oxidase-like deaminating enzyme
MLLKRSMQACLSDGLGVNQTLQRVQTDPVPPARADVVVIGGGIIGAATAFFLAKRGVSVTLCEKGLIAAEQSSRNLGWCRTTGRTAVEMPLMLESMRIWQESRLLLGAETGFQQSGLLYGCDSDSQLQERRSWLEVAAGHGIETRVVSGSELEALLPGALHRPRAAIYTATDGRAEPSTAAPAFAAAARRLGAVIVENCAARGIETAAGRVSGVETEKGVIGCTSAVLAGGVWSRLFCGHHEIALPQLKTLASVMRTTPVTGLPDVVSTLGSYAFSKRADGGYTLSSAFSSVADIVPDSFRLLRQFLPILISERKHTRLRFGRRFLTEWRMPRHWQKDAPSPMETCRTLDPHPVSRDLDAPFRDLIKDFPEFGRARILARWAGYIDATPDAIPVISPAQSLPGLMISTGYSGHGFGIGPGAGHLTADLVQGVRPLVDPFPFRLERFA